MSTPLDPEERAFWRKRTGLPGEVLMAQVVARLLAERDSLERERDEAREQVRSLTVERDAARLPEAERADLWGMIADRDRRLSRAREALKPVREAFEALCNADVFPTDGGPESQTADQLGAGLAAMRAALAEPLGGGP